MMRLGNFFRIILLAATLVVLRVEAETTNAPSFKEIYDLIRSNGVVSDAELNRDAVNGLLFKLQPKAAIVTNDTETPGIVMTQLVSKVFVFENEIAYLRIAAVGEGLAEDLRAAYQQLGATNKLKGLVLDLRFAGGNDYSAAVAASELLPLKKTAVLDWGASSRETRNSGNTLSAPAVVLVNGDTRAAAEALAALLHESDSCLLLGSPTAGHALISKIFPLSDGEKLRIATAAVKLNGTELSHVRPDIEVPVPEKDERNFYNGAFLTVPKMTDLAFMATNSSAGTTNFAMRRPRLTEAELVRAHKQGLNLDSDLESADLPRINTPQTPTVSDPVLSRAVDLLKALAIVRAGSQLSAPSH